MSYLNANQILEKLGEIDIYVVIDWADPTKPCVVRGYRESERPTDEAEEIAHRSSPSASGEGSDYREALDALYQKVSGR